MRLSPTASPRFHDVTSAFTLPTSLRHCHSIEEGGGDRSDVDPIEECVVRKIAVEKLSGWLEKSPAVLGGWCPNQGPPRRFSPQPESLMALPVAWLEFRSRTVVSPLFKFR